MNLLSFTKPLALVVAVAAFCAPLAAHAAVPGESQLKGTVPAYDGLTLRPGQQVTVLGNKDATGVFAANEIDTPYRVRYAPAFAYPYAGFANPFYGPAFYGGPFFGYGFGF